MLMNICKHYLTLKYTCVDEYIYIHYLTPKYTYVDEYM